VVPFIHCNLKKRHVDKKTNEQNYSLLFLRIAPVSFRFTLLSYYYEMSVKEWIPSCVLRGTASRCVNKFCAGKLTGVNLGLSHRLKVLENRVLRRVFGPKREEEAGGGEDCTVKRLITRTLHKLLLG
jgi:hypothetical protein